MNNKKLIKQIANLEKLAQDRGWKFYYDSELDSLYFIQQKLSDDARLYSIGEEVNLYLTPKLEVQGLFMEYFKSNYLIHEKEFKNIPKLFTKAEGGFKTVPQKQRNKLKLLETALKAEILSELVQDEKTPVILP